MRYEAKEAKQEIDIAYENELYPPPPPPGKAPLLLLPPLPKNISRQSACSSHFYAFYSHFQFFSLHSPIHGRRRRALRSPIKCVLPYPGLRRLFFSTVTLFIQYIKQTFVFFWLEIHL